MRNSDGFSIQRGVLYRYRGPGGDVTLPASLTRIDPRAFTGCRSLTDITVPAGGTEIDERAFSRSEKLTIHAPAGSAAERYAGENGIKFEAL